jgi:hypothetical protein
MNALRQRHAPALEHLRAALFAILAELVRLNRFAIADEPQASRRERARKVAAALTRRYRSPHRCC